MQSTWLIVQVAKHGKWLDYCGWWNLAEDFHGATVLARINATVYPDFRVKATQYEAIRLFDARELKVIS